jgi:nitronate monooxygenase
VRLPSNPARVVLAPMAGGPGTPELAAAVSNAGGLGFVPTGYLPVDRVHDHLTRFRSLSSGPLGVNVFVPADPDPDRLERASAYADRVADWAGRLDLAVGTPGYTDDDYDAKVELVLEARPDIASFTFGLPRRDVVTALQEAGIAVAVTVNNPDEATLAVQVGADALVVQGAEAGAHQGGWLPVEGDPVGLLPLLQLVRRVTDVPLIAGGGIATGAGLAAVLAAGAEAGMVGTAFLRCPEAGTNPTHAAALTEPGGTTLTKAFSGRAARAIPNELTDALHAHAPNAYPEVNIATTPMRAQARQRNDIRAMHLWAGQARALADSAPAAEVVRQLARDARAAAARLMSVEWDGSNPDYGTST